FTLHLLNKELVYLMVSVDEADHERVQSIKKQWAQGSKRLWLSAGRICEWKGFDLIIKAFAQLRKNQIITDHEISLLIIGSPMREADHEYHHELKKLISREGLDNSVHLISFDSKWHDYLYA